MTDKEVLAENGLLEKAPTIKKWIFAIRQWGGKTNQHCKKCIYKGLLKVYEFDKREHGERTNKKQTLKKYSKS